MGFYEIAQKNLKKELLFLRETRDEMKKVNRKTNCNIHFVYAAPCFSCNCNCPSTD